MKRYQYTTPTLEFILWDNKAERTPSNLSGDTVFFTVATKEQSEETSPTYIVDREMTVDDANSGKVSIKLTSSETATTGIFLWEINVIGSNTRVPFGRGEIKIVPSVRQ